MHLSSSKATAESDSHSMGRTGMEAIYIVLGLIALIVIGTHIRMK